MISSYREYIELQGNGTLSEREKQAIRNLEMERHGPYVSYCNTHDSFSATAVFRIRAKES